MNSISILKQWIKENTQLLHNDKQSLFSLLLKLGLTKIIHVRMTMNHLHVDRFTESVPSQIIDYIENVDNFQEFRSYESDSNLSSVKILDNTYHIINKETDSFNNTDLILSSFDPKVISLELIQDATTIASEILRLSLKNEALESSLQITYASLSNTSQTIERSILEVSDVPQSFIDNAVPTTWYGVAHEQIGPTFILTDPESINVIENMDKIVNVFSTLDSNMITEIGHVFSINPVKSPTMGEVVSIIFSVANDKARGAYELHAISALISQRFMNMAKTIHIDLTSILFSAAESIRTNLNKTEINIATTSYEELNELLNSSKLTFVKPVLNSVKFEISRTLGSLIKKTELVSWDYQS